MIKDVTLGQFYPADSVIHKLDPRTKLVISFVYFLSLFLADSKYMFLVAIVFYLLYRIPSKLPPGYMLRGLKGVAVLLMLAVVLQVIFGQGEPWITLGFIKISYLSLRSAVYTALRIVLLVLASSVLTYTTTPTKLTDGLEHGFRWMKVFRVPIHDLAMVVGIALRFIPIMVGETDRIMKSQKARGASLETGNWFSRLKATIPVLVPTFLSAIRRAGELGDAMEARCYRGGEGRTKYKQLVYGLADYIAYGILLVYVVLMVFLRIQMSDWFMYISG